MGRELGLHLSWYPRRACPKTCPNQGLEANSLCGWVWLVPCGATLGVPRAKARHKGATLMLMGPNGADSCLRLVQPCGYTLVAPGTQGKPQAHNP